MFKTYGAAIESLTAFLLPLRREVHSKHYSTPRYFVELNLVTHRGFEAWCLENGYIPTEMNEMRRVLIDNCIRYGRPELFTLESLVSHIPDEYNVRGQWTPTSLK